AETAVLRFGARGLVAPRFGPRITALPISASNLIGCRVVALTTHPIRYPRGHGGGRTPGGWLVLNVVPSAGNTTLPSGVTVMKKSCSRQMLELTFAAPGQTQ